MWAMDGRGCGAAGPLVPTLAGIASRVSPRPQLHSGSPSGAGSTAIQRKATQRAQVSPTLTRPGALTPPPQRGRYKEGSWSPPPFLGLLSSFAPKSSHSFSLHFFSFWVFLNYPPFFVSLLLSLCPPPLAPFSISLSIWASLLPHPSPFFPWSPFRYAKPILGRVHLTRTKQKAHKNVSEKNKKFKKMLSQKVKQ